MTARPLRFFPMAFGLFRHHPELDTKTEVDGVAALLAEFGLRTVEWDTHAEKRGADEVTERLEVLHALDEPADTFLYWLGHGWSNDAEAALAVATSPPDYHATGMRPDALAASVATLQSHRHAADTWAIVVVDACRSAQFARLMSNELILRLPPVRRLLVVGVSGAGSTRLGDFRLALERVVDNAHRASDIRLADLASELERLLPDDAWVLPIRVGDEVLARRAAVPSGVTLDVFAEVKAALAHLSPDERGHFIPKAQGGEIGELAWYFEGREAERRTAARWLRDTESGLLVVTGPAGSGKSAFLGHLVEQSRPGLRRVLLDAGLVEPVPEPDRPPDDVFDAVVHMTGLTGIGLITQLGRDLGVPPSPGDQPLETHVQHLLTALAAEPATRTVLIDALDEAQQPTVIARDVIRPLSTLPGTRVLVGTRASTLEGPDHATPDSQDLLDALGDGVHLRVAADPSAVARYVTKRLRAQWQPGPDLHRRAAEVGELIGAQQRHFLYARLAVHELLAGALFDTDAVAALLAHDHRDLFAAAVTRLTAENPAFAPLLHALGLARGRGLPILGGVWLGVARALSPATPVDDADVDALLTAARPYLTVDVEGDQTVYRLAHATFAEHYADTEAGHQAVVEALLALADADQREQVNAYVREYLPVHAAVAGVSAWRDLAAHPWTLDRLAPTAVAANAMRSLFGRHPVPAQIRAVIGAHHILQSLSPADRVGNRQLATARFAGVTHPAPRPAGHPFPGRWTVTWADLAQAPLHLALSCGHREIRELAVVRAADDRALLAVGSTANAIELWDPVESRRVGAPLTSGPYSLVAMTSFTGTDGETLLAATYGDGSLLVWDPLAGTVRARLTDPLAPHNIGRTVTAFRFADGHTELMAGYMDGSVLRWDPVTGEVVHRLLSVNGTPVRGLAPYVTENGNAFVAIADDDARLHVRRLDDTGREAFFVAAMAKRAGKSGLIAFTNPAGHPMLAYCNEENSIALVHGTLLLPSGRPMPHRPRIWSIVTVPDAEHGTLLVSAGSDQTVRLWDPATGEPVAGPLTGHNGAIRALASFPGPHGQHMVASGGSDGTIRVWDIAELRGTNYGGHAMSQLAAVTALRGEDGGDRVVAAGTDGTLHTWNPSSPTDFVETRSAVDVTFACTVVEPAEPVAPDHWLLATGTADGIVRLWTTSVADPVAETRLSRTTTAITVYHDLGRPWVATGHADGTVHLWDPSTTTTQLVSCSARVSSLAAFPGPNGEPVLAVLADGVVQVVHARSGEPLDALRADSPIAALHAFAGPDGVTRLVTGSADGTVRVWTTATGELVAGPFTAHSGRVFAVETDGVRLVTSGLDGTVQLWDPTTGASLGELSHNTVPAQALAALTGGDGEPLLAMATDRVVRVRAPDGTVVTVARSDGKRVSSLARLAGTGDRPLLAVADSGGRVELWDPVSGLVAGELAAGAGATVVAAIPVYAEAASVADAPAMPPLGVRRSNLAVIDRYGTGTTAGLAIVAADLKGLHMWNLHTASLVTVPKPKDFRHNTNAVGFYRTRTGVPHAVLAAHRSLCTYDLMARRWSPATTIANYTVNAMVPWVHSGHTYVLLAGIGSRVRVWDPDSPAEPLRTLLDTGQPRIQAMTTLPGDLLATANDGQTLSVWHLLSNTRLDTIPLDVTITALAATPTGLAVATEAGVLELALTLPAPAFDGQFSLSDLPPDATPDHLTDGAMPELPPGRISPDRDHTLHRLLGAITDTTADEEGWASLADVGHLFATRYPEYAPRLYGYTQLSTLAEATGQFDLTLRYPHPNEAPVVYIRRRPTRR